MPGCPVDMGVFEAQGERVPTPRIRWESFRPSWARQLDRRYALKVRTPEGRKVFDPAVTNFLSADPLFLFFSVFFLTFFSF